MRVIRAVLAFLGGTLSLIRRAYVVVRDRLAILTEGILGPPIAALGRAASALRRSVDRAIAFLLQAWSRLFKRAPAAPRRRVLTPGITGVPLIAATVTVLVAYLPPWARWFTFTDDQFVLACVGGAVGVGVVVRALLRRRERGRLVRGLIDVHRRAGLVWLDRLALLACGAALIATWSNEVVRPAPALAAIGFLVLATSDDRGRELDGDLSPLPEPPAVDEDRLTELRQFAWTATIGGEDVDYSVEVTLDRDLLDRMRSENLGRPIDTLRPDFSPWVVDGTTAEVGQVAAAIRVVAEDRGHAALDEAIAALTFAQSLYYSSDEESAGRAEYWRFPIETIADREGDCEDSAILGLAICRLLGVDAVPLVTDDHAAYGLVVAPGTPGAIRVDELHLLYAETTSTFTLGSLPEGIEPSDLRLCEPRVGRAAAVEAA